MSMLANGGHECDRCGRDVGNGSLLQCAVLSVVDKTTGGVVNLHFCCDVVDEEGTVTHKGCTRKVLSKSNVAHYLEKQEEE